MTEKPDSTVEDATPDQSAATADPVMICVRDADGGFSSPPPELLEVFGQWFSEMGRRYLGASQRQAAAEMKSRTKGIKLSTETDDGEIEIGR
jgi:hypothetical protein